MGRNTKENKNHIKKLLKEMKVNFRTVKNENDVCYIIYYSPEEFLKNTEFINILLFYSFDMNTLLAICPNIYKLRKGDSTLNIFYALNNTNTKLYNGNVTLNNEFVAYKYQEKFTSIDFITKEKLENIFDDIVVSLIYTCEEIRKMKDYE